tara:strand:+ start:196 stop:705 length:510 start_codon:yes stop_codon:yes gene_type:complete
MDSVKELCEESGLGVHKVKPFVYVSSPYTQGRQDFNVNFQMRIWKQLMDDGKVYPHSPVVGSHFQGMFSPLNWDEWMSYDLALIELMTESSVPVALLRLNSTYVSDDGEVNYLQEDSKGADLEVAAWLESGCPVFYTVESLYEWSDNLKDWRPRTLMERAKKYLARYKP